MIPEKTKCIGSALKESPIYIPGTPIHLVNDGNSFLSSRRIANKIILSFALLQIYCFGFLSWKVAHWHLFILFQISQSSDSFTAYVLWMIPGLITLPILVGMIVWPTFILFGSFKSHDSQDLDTIEKHLYFLRLCQATFYSYILERIHKNEVKAFCQSIGSRIPNDVKVMIVQKLENDLYLRTRQALAPLLWKSTLRYTNQPTWKRVMQIWSLFSGVHDSYGIPTHLPLKYNGFWLMVLSRDGALITFSCLLRYSLILWLTSRNGAT